MEIVFIFVPSKELTNDIKQTKMKTNRTYYRVNKIYSQRVIEREKMEPREVETVIGDFNTLEEAKIAYDKEGIGAEIDKELIQITEGEMGDSDVVIETTF